MTADTEIRQSKSDHPRDWDSCLWIHPFGGGLEGLELTFLHDILISFQMTLSPKNHIYYRDTNGIRNRLSLLWSGS